MKRSLAQSALDELLVIAWKRGTREAGEQLVARWQPRLWRHARLLTDSPDEASEAVQGAWASMVRAKHRLRDPARFGPWAYRIVTRRCADIVRQRQRSRQTPPGVLESVAQRESPPDDRAEPLHIALASLPGDERAMLTLVHVDGLPLRYVAEIFDIPIGTVKSRLHATRAKLRTHIEGEHHEQAR